MARVPQSKTLEHHYLPPAKRATKIINIIFVHVDTYWCYITPPLLVRRGLFLAPWECLHSLNHGHVSILAKPCFCLINKNILSNLSERTSRCRLYMTTCPRVDIAYCVHVATSLVKILLSVMRGGISNCVLFLGLCNTVDLSLEVWDDVDLST